MGWKNQGNGGGVEEVHYPRIDNQVRPIDQNCVVLLLTHTQRSPGQWSSCQAHNSRETLFSPLSQSLSLGLPQHAVIPDVRTRWNSLFLVVERFLEQFSTTQAASAKETRGEKQALLRRMDIDISLFHYQWQLLCFSDKQSFFFPFLFSSQKRPKLSALEKLFAEEDMAIEVRTEDTVSTTEKEEMQTEATEVYHIH